MDGRVKPGHDEREKRAKNVVAPCRIGPLRFVLGPQSGKNEPFIAKLIFVNLPVSDLKRANALAIGGAKNEQFSDDTASCMVFSDTIYAMLLTHDKYRRFTSKKIVDAKTSSEVLICMSADSRAEVDDLVGKAKAAGGGARSNTATGFRLDVWPQLRGSR